MVRWGLIYIRLGFPVGISYEEFNLFKPEMIADVHRRYYEAGARFIETNTFSANREKLSKYGLEDDVEAINQAGVELAEKRLVTMLMSLGAIGSIRAGKRKNVRTTDVEESSSASRLASCWIRRWTGYCLRLSMIWKSCSLRCALFAA